MKRLLIIAVILCCSTAFAEYKGVQITILNAPTGVLAQVTKDIRGVTGKPVSFSISLETNGVTISGTETVTVSVATIAQTGSSLDAVKTLLGSSNLTSGRTSNSLATMYFYSDTLRLTVTNSVGAANLDVSVFLILED